MAVDEKALKAALKKDNPSFERVLKSDLHDVVELASKPGVTAKLLSKEMKLVKPEKWQKYKNTRTYLLKEVPGLEEALAAKLINFKTKSLSKGGAGAIVHVLSWASSTHDLKDLQGARVRERVWWEAPNGETKPFVDPAYAKSGQHTGVGNAAFTAGNMGKGDDTHNALGPFTPKIFDLEPNVVLESILQQVYEVSYDNGASWAAIPNSRYQIRRRVARVDPKTVRLAIEKTGPDKLSNSHDIKH